MLHCFKVGVWKIINHLRSIFTTLFPQQRLCLQELLIVSLEMAQTLENNILLFIT